MISSPNTAANKPSMVKDALTGLMTAIAIGLVSSMIFVMVVLFLSSQAFASPL